MIHNPKINDVIFLVPMLSCFKHMMGKFKIIEINGDDLLLQKNNTILITVNKSSPTLYEIDFIKDLLNKEIN